MQYTFDEIKTPSLYPLLWTRGTFLLTADGARDLRCRPARRVARSDFHSEMGAGHTERKEEAFWAKCGSTGRLYAELAPSNVQRTSVESKPRLGLQVQRLPVTARSAPEATPLCLERLPRLRCSAL